MITRNMATKIVQLESRFEDLKLTLIKELKADLISELRSYIDVQVETIRNLTDTITRHESTISVLQTTVQTLKNENDNLRKKIESDVDELEQYSRRQCLRIDGVILGDEIESSESIVSKVHGFMKDSGVKCTDMVIDRAHRVGPIYRYKENQKCQSIIAKFNNFRYRTMFYQNRNKLKE